MKEKTTTKITNGIILLLHVEVFQGVQKWFV